ncbi:EDD domain protein, DegV family [Dehalogenimonas formicexedens]|uniref:EDD domain protein, DegV family n=1 Tax=Dehalogenimonas formicexedens TaxID=1839801 RepID=A0A1P8F8N4_9CHLR|nr:DegV family protein [Dehalogenimonas formicexedens]APV44793.1 EDD domain protein, DegV family [Dehalogenimonas formicexedens]
MAVKIITDSTSDIPKSVADALDIRVVPIYVRFGDKTYRDGVDIDPVELYRLLTTLDMHPATSQPNPEDFVAVYNECCCNSDGILSIHISSKISGTYNSACLAKKSLAKSCSIEVMDSKFNSAGLGLVVLAAARKAKCGGSLAEVIAETNKAIAEIKMLGMFKTMKYLARSGRVNKTIASAAHFLSVMPLLTFHSGEITRAGFVRTVTQGMKRIIDFVNNNMPVKELSIVHSEVPNDAARLKECISEFVPEEKIAISQMGAGLGVHGGPGVLLVGIRT